jgi:DNA-binding SARP family transcriptional activator/tetratricopeptide (TPR) repeat protein/DNA-binding XRE family transcriptional regulator
MEQHGARPPGLLATLMRTHREATGLTQRQLASRSGISLGTLRDLEQGRTFRPRPPSLACLAEALQLSGCQRDELIGALASPAYARQATPSEQQHRAGHGDRGLRVEILGPLAAWRDGLPVALGPVRQRAVLGLLALHADTGIHRAAIVDALWGEDPPSTSVSMVQAQVSGVRRLLRPGPAPGAGGPVSWDGSCYRLSVGGVRLDLGEFSELTERARQVAATGDAAAACELYDQALGLWRGQPLEDIDVLRGHPAVTGLGRRRAAVVIEYAAAAAGTGLLDRVIAHLEALAVREPLDERAHAQLMVTLAATGHHAFALRVYQDLAARLDNELGVRPGPELSAAHLQILRQQIPPAFASAAAGAARPELAAAGSGRDRGPSAADPVVPRQLPPAVPRFAGRAAELAALTSVLDQAAGAGGTIVISAIDGTAGIGKTALAVHWAHQFASRFPDGQLHINLRGFGPSGPPVTAAEAIRLFLDGLGVPPERIPAGLAAQAGLCRSVLAGQRMLIVLDNARDCAQVRPLLPASPGCLVLVTSRSQLTGLVAADGAHLLTLDVLTEAEAREMLARRLGSERVTAEPAAVTELTGLCARLPLALAIAAARAAARPGLPLAALAAELRGTRARLDGLGTGDAATDVRTVFSWSCQQLSGPAAGMFRLLGVHPGPDITAAAAGSLAGVPPGQARQALAELASAHLVTEYAPGRYAFHDLLRAYAAEQTRSHDSDASRRAALQRVLDHYLHTASAASVLLYPYRDPITLSPLQPRVRPEELADRQQALEWFQAERQVLLASISLAAGDGFSAHAWQLPWAAAMFFDWRGYWHELAATQESALAAAWHLGDRAGQAQAHHYIGQARIRLGAYAEAGTQLTAALELGRQLGSTITEARAHLDLGRTFELQGRSGDALGHAEQALQLYRATGHRPGEANALNAVGWCLAQLGRYQDALGSCAEALAVYRELGNRPAEATTLDSLGYAHCQLGHHSEAIACYRQAIDVHGDAGDLGNRAEMLTHLGDAHQATGDSESARRAWQQALAILDDLHESVATAEVRSRLARRP